jgi:hypothetical protein
MADPSPRKNLPAAAAMVVLLVILTAGMVPAHKLYITSRIHTRIHDALCSCLDPSCILAEPSECWSWPDGCNLHLSGAYKLRAVLAMEGRRLQQSMLRRKQQQLFRRLLFLSMLVLYQMRPLRLLLRLLLPLQSGLVWYYKSNRVE